MILKINEKIVMIIIMMNNVKMKIEMIMIIMIIMKEII